MLESSVNEIKDRLDIVEVISEYIKLFKAGKNFKALCPFHNEKTPSFMINPERQIWHCFGCGEGGDIFTFVMKMDGVEFPEALKTLADKAGVELKRENAGAASQRKKVFEVMEAAVGFYENILRATSDGREAMDYLAGRGLTAKSIKEWRIGFSPGDWRKTLEYLLSRNFQPAEILAAGLIIEKASVPGKAPGSAAAQRYYDRFRGRIMFPISDPAGRAIGFGARVFKNSTEKKEAAKYINTPQTVLYNKSRVLYGLDKAKSSIGKSDFCILVEGYTDVIASVQAGIRNVVSSSGTSLAIEQLRLIKRYTDNLAISYDMDLAGEGATRRGIELALEQGFNIKVVRLPDDQDPADCIQDDPAIWQAAIRNKKPILDYYFEDAFSRFDPGNISGKKSIVEFLLPIVSKVSSSLERSDYLKRLGEKLNLEDKVLLDEMKRLQPEKPLRPQAGRSEKTESREANLGGDTAQLEEILIGLAVGFAGDLKDEFDKIDADIFSDAAWQAVAGSYAEYLKAIPSAGSDQVRGSVAWQKEFIAKLQPEHREKVNMLVFRVEEKYRDKGIDVRAEFSDIHQRLRRLRLKAKFKRLGSDIRKAEEKGDVDARKVLVAESNKISKELEKF